MKRSLSLLVLAFVAAGLLLASTAQKAGPPATVSASEEAAKAAATAPPILPAEQELSLERLEQPSERATICYQAYKAGKFDEARKLAEELAKAGDLNGMFIAAVANTLGRGGEASVLEAERLLRAAADQGHQASRTNLAFLLFGTAGNDKDRQAEGIRILHESVKKEPAMAALTLGELYARGLGVTTDFGQAQRFFEAAVSAGVKRGLLAQAMLYDGSYGFEKQRAAEHAEELFKKAADQGVLEALLILGRKKIAESKGKGPLLEEGLKWLEKAGEQGSGEACLALGVAHEEGEVVKKDAAKAFAFYEKGQKLGYAPAIARAGSCHENGIGVEKDARKAFALYKEAGERGLALAVYNMGVCYDSGAGTEKDSASAFRCYLLAAQSGFAQAMNEVGMRYQAGIGVVADVVAAGSWYAMAVQTGFTPAQVNLARLHLQGLGVPKNVATAAQLYASAVNAGNAQAAYELGQLFELGAGVERDTAKAHALLGLAEEAKIEGAKERRETLAKTLSKDDLAKSTVIRKELPQLAPGIAPKKRAESPS